MRCAPLVNGDATGLTPLRGVLVVARRPRKNPTCLVDLRAAENWLLVKLISLHQVPSTAFYASRYGETERRKVGSGDWIKTNELRVISPTNCHCFTRAQVIVLAYDV